MEFRLNFSVGFTAPPVMLVIRNLVLVHKVKSKEAMFVERTQKRESMQNKDAH